MKSVNQIVKDYFIGKTLAGLEWDANRDRPTSSDSVIKTVYIGYDGEDPKLYLGLENDDEIEVYMNEGIKLK